MIIQSYITTYVYTTYVGLTTYVYMIFYVLHLSCNYKLTGCQTLIDTLNLRMIIDYLSNRRYYTVAVLLIRQFCKLFASELNPEFHLFF